MEGGSRFLEYITYGIIAFVLAVMIYFFGRTLKFVLGFLSLPFSDLLQRWPTTCVSFRTASRSPPGRSGLRSD